MEENKVVATGAMSLDELCVRIRGWEADLEAKGINVEQVTLIATSETTHEPAAEHTKALAGNSAIR